MYVGDDDEATVVVAVVATLLLMMMMIEWIAMKLSRILSCFYSSLFFVIIVHFLTAISARERWPIDLNVFAQLPYNVYGGQCKSSQ